MKWLVIVSFLVYLATFSEGSVLRCSPASSKDCVRLDKEKVEPQSNERTPVDLKIIKCLAGSEWNSSCHSCRCSDDGQPQCAKLDKCEDVTYGESMTCKPLSEFHRDCNLCICLESGMGASCTTLECPLGMPLLLDGQECQKGSKWRSRCNNCTCENGVPACTDMACPGKEDEPELTCDPGTEWKIECNTCTCLPSGVGVCSRMGCNLYDASDFNPRDQALELAMVSQNRVKRWRVCNPNATYKVDCNSCKCASDGQSYSCTLNECKDDDYNAHINQDVDIFIEKQNTEKVCKPRGTFHIGCNTCLCTVDGTDFSCTNKPCPLPDDVEIFRELKASRSAVNKKSVVCTANRMFIKDCNTCWCNDDGTRYFCTRRVCVAQSPQDLQEIKRKCRPDEVFEIDCNMCRCSADGMSFSCTRRACIGEDDGKNVSLARKIRSASQGTLKACQPGQEFRKDCNKCLCNNEGQDFSCTRIDCIALNNNGNGGDRAKREITNQVKAGCEAGSVFKQGCDSCQCLADGNHATCSVTSCQEDNSNENEIKLPDSFTCVPGEELKRVCNDCVCSADGKTLLCALRDCNPDVPPAI